MTDSPSGARAASSRTALRATLRAILLDVVPPLLIFYVLRTFGVSDVLAYVAGSIVPVARLIADRLRGRPFNAISGLVVVFLVVSVALALITQDARAAIARGGLIFLAIAIAAAVSVPTRSPLMLSLSRYFAVSARPEDAARFDEVYRRPPVLRAMRVVTLVWALAFAVSAVVCVVCAYALPVAVANPVTALFEPVVSLALAVGTVRYLRRAATPAEARRRAGTSTAAGPS
ncbi:VC0807 family protein [Amycolatopsis saalfeldensis]|uniref:Intracellular septation protein A n=1 Tax=Amycolatopsis saalfeldensis TaxID=394193 RepID=A0A1H8Y242_9PSEU|nr:VC0807 family protein [Amycolatopsis saalfeldensis]SEP46364.1 hypothetical protein SAMN04489732_110242 [Amycolatopsis saalfeldensis]